MSLERKDLFLLRLLKFFQLIGGYQDNGTSNPVKLILRKMIKYNIYY